MGTLPMTEKGQPDFNDDEVVMIRTLAHKLKEMIVNHLEAPTINRQRVLNFCDIVDRLRDLASGNPQRLREYLDA